MKYLIQIVDHPLIQYGGQKLSVIYHFWVLMQEKKDWKQTFGAYCGSRKYGTLKQRINKLPDQLKSVFEDLLKERDYEENDLGMLEISKNLINH